MYKLKVDTMHCKSCVRNIEDVLKDVDSSLVLQASLEQQTITVETKLPLDEIKKLIEEEGYKVTALVS